MFIGKEIDYTNSRQLVRLATVLPSQPPDVAPVAFHFDGERFFVSGFDITKMFKYKNVKAGNEPELISQTLADWAAEHGIRLALIQPGKPAQNAFIERFNRTYREAVLDAYLFDSVAEAHPG